MQRAELAHIARVSTMGEIATGLAHELNQPLAAIRTTPPAAQAMASGSARQRQETAFMDREDRHQHASGRTK